jgi:hypothetical protein
MASSAFFFGFIFAHSLKQLQQSLVAFTAFLTAKE